MLGINRTQRAVTVCQFVKYGYDGGEVIASPCTHPYLHDGPHSYEEQADGQ